MFSRTILTIILCASVVLSGGEADEALFTAARNGDSSAITAALEGGADVNARNRYEATPLLNCCLLPARMSTSRTAFMRPPRSVGQRITVIRRS